MIRIARVLLLIALLFTPSLMDRHLLHAATSTGVDTVLPGRQTVPSYTTWMPTDPRR